VTSETDEFAPIDTVYNAESDYRDKEIHIRHFVVRGNKIEKNLDINDAVRNCPVDLELSFIEDNPRITDLDNDDVSEIWVIYHLGCHGDVSPTEMKIIMIVDDKQYMLRGQRVANIGFNREVGGEIYSNAFDKLTPVFKNYSDSLWKKHIRWN